MAQTKLPYQKVIRVNDTVLITSLFCYGIRALEGYRQSPNYEICFLFFDNAETNEAIKKFYAGKLMVNALQYSKETHELLTWSYDYAAALEHDIRSDAYRINRILIPPTGMVDQHLE